MPGYEKRPRQRDIADPQTHAAVREQREAIEELQRQVPRSKVLERINPNNSTEQFITLTNGSVTKIPHGLGRAYKDWRFTMFELPQSVADAGEVFEVTEDSSGNKVDKTRELWLKVVGYGGGSNHPKVRIKVS